MMADQPVRHIKRAVLMAMAQVLVVLREGWMGFVNHERAVGGYPLRGVQ